MIFNIVFLLIPYSLPSGLVIMYHHQLGLTTDTVVEHYKVPALALAHLALPWVQIAQIQAGLQDKIRAEAGKHMYDTTPLTVSTGGHLCQHICQCQLPVLHRSVCELLLERFETSGYMSKGYSCSIVA